MIFWNYCSKNANFAFGYPLCFSIMRCRIKKDYIWKWCFLKPVDKGSRPLEMLNEGPYSKICYSARLIWQMNQEPVQVIHQESTNNYDLSSTIMTTTSLQLSCWSKLWGFFGGFFGEGGRDKCNLSTREHMLPKDKACSKL